MNLKISGLFFLALFLTNCGGKKESTDRRKYPAGPLRDRNQDRFRRRANLFRGGALEQGSQTELQGFRHLDYPEGKGGATGSGRDNLLRQWIPSIIVYNSISR